MKILCLHGRGSNNEVTLRPLHLTQPVIRHIKLIRVMEFIIDLSSPDCLSEKHFG